MIAKAGAGPDPIPQKEMNAERLADALKFVGTSRAKQAAQKMGEQIRSEVGSLCYNRLSRLTPHTGWGFTWSRLVPPSLASAEHEVSI